MTIPNVNTYHWDTVYVASLEVLNTAIQQTGSFPSKFDYKDTPTGVAINGAWSNWALGVEGSGGLIQMQTAIASGTATGVSETADLTNGTLTIQFELEQIGYSGKTVPDPTAKPGTGTPTAQRFPQAGSNPVNVVATSFPNLDPNKAPILKDILQTIFQNYFNAHLNDIKATFHVMMINEVADKDGFQWVKPSAVSYAVGGPSKNKTLKNTAFGILAMTDGANSAFVISPAKVTKHMLLKGAVTTIQGSQESDFSISDSGLSIVTAKDLTWGHFKLESGSIISPTIKAGDFLMRMDGDHVHLEINNAAYSPSRGITVYLNLEQNCGFKTVKREDGKYIFIPDVNSFRNPKIHSNVQVAEWLTITDIVIGVVGGIAALAGGISAVADLLAGAADTVISSSTDAIVDITEDSFTDIENDLDEESWLKINDKPAQDADDGINAPNNAGQVQSGSFLKSTQFRTYCGLTAAIAGLTAAGMAVAGPVTSKIYSKIPPFDDFAANVLGASQFPVLQNYDLLGASLRTSLVASI